MLGKRVLERSSKRTTFVPSKNTGVDLLVREKPVLVHDPVNTLLDFLTKIIMRPDPVPA